MAAPIWNVTKLDRPVTLTFCHNTSSIDEDDVEQLRCQLKTAVSYLNNSGITSEQFTYSRVLYKLSNQWRLKWSFQHLRKFWHCLSRLEKFGLQQSMVEVLKCVGERDKLVTKISLPSKQMIEYLLDLTLGGSVRHTTKVVLWKDLTLVGSVRHTTKVVLWKDLTLGGSVRHTTKVVLWKDLTLVGSVRHTTKIVLWKDLTLELSVGEFISHNLLFVALLSRIWVLLKALLLEVIAWYSKLVPWREKLKAGAMEWLPKGEVLPDNLLDWLGPENDPSKSSRLVQQNSSLHTSYLNKLFNSSQFDDDETLIPAEESQHEDMFTEVYTDIGEPITAEELENSRKRKREFTSTPNTQPVKKKKFENDWVMADRGYFTSSRSRRPLMNERIQTGDFKKAFTQTKRSNTLEELREIVTSQVEKISEKLSLMPELVREKDQLVTALEVSKREEKDVKKMKKQVGKFIKKMKKYWFSPAYERQNLMENTASVTQVTDVNEYKQSTGMCADTEVMTSEKKTPNPNYKRVKSSKIEMLERKVDLAGDLETLLSATLEIITTGQNAKFLGCHHAEFLQTGNRTLNVLENEQKKKKKKPLSTTKKTVNKLLELLQSSPEKNYPLQQESGRMQEKDIELSDQTDNAKQYGSEKKEVLVKFAKLDQGRDDKKISENQKKVNKETQKTHFEEGQTYGNGQKDVSGTKVNRDAVYSKSDSIKKVKQKKKKKEKDGKNSKEDILNVDNSMFSKSKKTYTDTVEIAVTDEQKQKLKTKNKKKKKRKQNYDEDDISMVTMNTKLKGISRMTANVPKLRKSTTKTSLDSTADSEIDDIFSSLL
ncbi:uncharacterized protein LOC144453574 [Glandiceps talaboti]